jgi:hypothetical protein
VPNQAVQIVGSLLILIPFILSIRGHLQVRGWYYLGSNLIGSATLAIDAAFGRQWGFLLLEAVWAIVSAGTIVKIAITGQTRATAGRTSQESQAPVGH